MILVAGATGNLGSAITRMLLAQGKEVRILVRPQSNYQPLVQAGAQPVFGDLKDRASLDPACAGVDTVITTANTALRGGEDNVETVDLEGNRNLIDAAKRAAVKHFIFVSALIADPDSPVPFLQAKGKTEQYLRASELPYTILAPDAFMEAWVSMVVGMPARNGLPVTVIGQNKRLHSFISAADVAAYAIAAVDDPAAMNQRLVLGGPRPLSWDDLVAAYEKELGHPVVLNKLNIGEQVPGLPEEMNAILTSFDLFDSVVDMKQLSNTFGVTPTTVEEFIKREVPAGKH
ncbi:MAG TPA: SDR family oxidoreductase [Chloroflexia bacterium]|nr:SDR family oxidoreductase [Chloroflexia bacterium]